MASLFAPFLLHEALFGGSGSAFNHTSAGCGAQLQKRPASAKGRPAARFHVTEDGTAYTLSAALPGYASTDVEVNVDSAARLLLVKGTKPSGTSASFHGLPASFTKTFELAQDADHTRAVASVTDGVLVVRVPKAQPVKTPVAVSPSDYASPPSSPTAAAAEREAGDHQLNYYSVNLPLPGLHASDLAVELTTPAHGTAGAAIVTVRVAPGAEGGAWASRYLASSSASGGVLGRYELPLDAGDAVEACCVDGMLKLRVPKAVTKLQVVAADLAQAEQQQQQQPKLVALASLPLAGYTPGDVSAELRERGTLLVVNAKHELGTGCWTHASHAVRLPRKVLPVDAAAAAGARLTLANGLLQLWAPEAALEPASSLKAAAVRALPVGKGPLLPIEEAAAAGDQDMGEGEDPEDLPALELVDVEGAGAPAAPAAAVPQDGAGKLARHEEGLSSSDSDEEE